METLTFTLWLISANQGAVLLAVNADGNMRYDICEDWGGGEGGVRP